MRLLGGSADAIRNKQPSSLGTGDSDRTLLYAAIRRDAIAARMLVHVSMRSNRRTVGWVSRTASQSSPDLRNCAVILRCPRNTRLCHAFKPFVCAGLEGWRRGPIGAATLRGSARQSFEA